MVLSNKEKRLLKAYWGRSYRGVRIRPDGTVEAREKELGGFQTVQRAPEALETAKRLEKMEQDGRIAKA